MSSIQRRSPYSSKYDSFNASRSVQRRPALIASNSLCSLFTCTPILLPTQGGALPLHNRLGETMPPMLTITPECQSAEHGSSWRKLGKLLRRLPAQVDTLFGFVSNRRKRLLSMRYGIPCNEGPPLVLIRFLLLTTWLSWRSRISTTPAACGGVAELFIRAVSADH